MSILSHALKQAVVGARGYDGAKMGRMYSDWFAHATSSDAEIRANFRRLLDRSRDLERNSDYWRGFLIALENNVVGALRRDLRMDAGEWLPASKNKRPVWQVDYLANTKIETAWEDWGKKGIASICGRYSWRTVKNLLVRTLARDGNVFIRKIRGPSAKNKNGFALQLWEIDHLDLKRFETLQGGGQIRFGIETDADGRPTAYYMSSRHSGDGYFGQGSQEFVRVPASDIVHLFVPERAEQSIGVPWCVSAITRLRQLGAFEEAAVIAARIGAANMGFFTKTAGPGGEIGTWTGDTNAAGNGIVEAQPGTMEELPLGWDVSAWKRDYPNIATGDFRKAMLRGMATGLGRSYTTIGNDLESVSFASSRVGLFEEREGYKALQLFMEENAYQPVFGDWLEMSMAAGVLNFPQGKFDKLNRPIFKGRRWAMIDPYKEIQALKTAIALRVNSRRGWMDEQGLDVEDVFADNLADEQLAADMDLSLTPPDPEPETSAGDPAADPDDPESITPATKPAKKNA